MPKNLTDISNIKYLEENDEINYSLETAHLSQISHELYEKYLSKIDIYNSHISLNLIYWNTYLKRDFKISEELINEVNSFLLSCSSEEYALKLRADWSIDEIDKDLVNIVQNNRDYMNNIKYNLSLRFRDNYLWAIKKTEINDFYEALMWTVNCSVLFEINKIESLENKFLEKYRDKWVTLENALSNKASSNSFWLDLNNRINKENKINGNLWINLVDSIKGDDLFGPIFLSDNKKNKNYIFYNKVWSISDKEEKKYNKDELNLLLLNEMHKENLKFEKLKRKFDRTPIPEPLRKRPVLSDEIKFFVWRRDEGKCVYCGSQEDLEFDHIIPFSKGGSSTSRNIQLLCEKCNREKTNNI